MAKLYATTSSTKTAKGVGDERLLTIDLKFGNERIGTLMYTILNKRPYLDIQLPDGQAYEVALSR